MDKIVRHTAPPNNRPQRVPKVNEDGYVTLDPWWGSIQPFSLHPEVATVGELEVIEHIESGGRVVDTRKADYASQSGVIPGAEVVPWEQILDGFELDPKAKTVFYCNGPQCAATPRAIKQLIDAGHSPSSMLYYRGGVCDWAALGLPLVGY